MNLKDVIDNLIDNGAKCISLSPKQLRWMRREADFYRWQKRDCWWYRGCMVVEW